MRCETVRASQSAQGKNGRNASELTNTPHPFPTVPITPSMVLARRNHAPVLVEAVVERRAPPLLEARLTIELVEVLYENRRYDVTKTFSWEAHDTT